MSVVGLNGAIVQQTFTARLRFFLVLYCLDDINDKIEHIFLDQSRACECDIFRFFRLQK